MALVYLLFFILSYFQTLQYPFQYGKSYPYGFDTYKYLTGLNGTWKPLDGVIYAFNYYTFEKNNKQHPSSKEIVQGMANGNTSVVCLDQNEHLLLDYDHDGQLDNFTDGHGYMRHNGRGIKGKLIANPFSLFLYEDNVLGKIINKVYGLKQPGGMSEYNDHVKWHILINKSQNWVPYKKTAQVELIILNGLYQLSRNNLSATRQNYQLAFDNFKKGKKNLYSGFKISQISLFAIFNQFLFEVTHQYQFLDQYIEFRKVLLNNLQYSQKGQILSWLQYINVNQNNFFTSDSMILGTLALSVGGDQIFQIGRHPLKWEKSSNFIYDNHQHMFSGIPGVSKPGYMMEGVQIKLQNEYYQIQLIFKSTINKNQTILGILQIKQNQKNHLKKNIVSHKLRKGWNSVKYSFKGTKKLWDFKIFWAGLKRLDISLFRITKLKLSTEKIIKKII